ncbi:MAG: pyridoxamine 5'-phosphate oxidase [Cytophagales bacterium]|nr:MAG: pyridoxamine 5'-phosphate oxidase [Cytophagales bacterium]
MDSPSEPTGIVDGNPRSLPDLNVDAWGQLTSAPTQKKHPFKTCFLATVAPDGQPDARTVVLRQADEAARRLWFHSDVRAGKIAHLQANPKATLLFWDDEAQVQLRCHVQTTIHTDDPIANEQWANVWEGSRKMYLSEFTPGSVQPGPYPGFPEPLGQNLPTRAESEAGRPNFAVVECRVMAMEYLRLSRAGQTRARFNYENGRFEWLAP